MGQTWQSTITFDPNLTHEPEFWREEMGWVLERLGYDYTEEENGCFTWVEKSEEDTVEVNRIHRLRDRGWSLRRIAEYVGTTVWRVRQTLSPPVPNVRAYHRKGKK
jgi:hypothetical protein